MVQWLKHLDRLLRGEATRPDALRDGDVPVETSGLAIVILMLGAIYGVCMGSFSLLKEIPSTVVDPYGRYLQLVATTIKVPALFYLTLLVTFPSLYVFNALVGSRLRAWSVLRLLITSLAVNLAVLSSLGPIVLFFSLSTKSHAFIVLLNVVVFASAGVLGLLFLLQTLHRLTNLEVRRASAAPSSTGSASAEPNPAVQSDLAGESTGREEPSALDMPLGQSLNRHTRLVFNCWVVLFAVVGAQMGWVLRPFVGSPYLPFEWFRERESNFFEAMLKTLSSLFSGG